MPIVKGVIPSSGIGYNLVGESFLRVIKFIDIILA
jgi:hypothetical protein